jgi:hypothetical protein
MQDLDKLELDNICKELLSAFQGTLAWKWDSRFETVLAEFNVNKKDSIRAILDRYFRNTWDSSNIDKAPRTVKKVNIYLGKLRSGQMLFSSDTTRPEYIYCAWWPWDDCKTISIRIAPCYKRLPDTKKAGRIQQFKGCFGL